MHFFYASPPKLAMIPENIDKEGSLPSVCLHSVDIWKQISLLRIVITDDYPYYISYKNIG